MIVMFRLMQGLLLLRRNAALDSSNILFQMQYS